MKQLIGLVRALPRRSRNKRVVEALGIRLVSLLFLGDRYAHLLQLVESACQCRLVRVQLVWDIDITEPLENRQRRLFEVGRRQDRGSQCGELFCRRLKRNGGGIAIEEWISEVRHAYNVLSAYGLAACAST